MAITLGSNMVLYRNSTAAANVFGASTTCSFNVTSSVIEITTEPTGSYVEILPTSTSFEITADGFITMDNISYYTLLGLQKNRTLVNVKFQILNAGGNVTINADVYVTSISISGPLETPGTYSVTLQGTGPYDFF